MQKIHQEVRALKKYSIGHLWADYIHPVNNEEGD